MAENKEINEECPISATATEKQEWMAHINRCIEDLLRKSGKKPVANHAAVWVPDNEANVCMHCKKTQFTMIVRRVSICHLTTIIGDAMAKCCIFLCIYSTIVGTVERWCADPARPRNSYCLSKVQSRCACAWTATIR